MINAVGRELPDYLDGFGKIKPFNGAFATLPDMPRQSPKVKRMCPGNHKVLISSSLP